MGIISEEAWECRLKIDSSDKELLAYPGYDKVWEEYLKKENDLDEETN